jgi:hypothetical protein
MPKNRNPFSQPGLSKIDQRRRTGCDQLQTNGPRRYSKPDHEVRDFWISCSRIRKITGKGPSNRHEISYFGESELGAVRIDDFKCRFIDQPGDWLGEKTKPDVPYLINLRLDPFERTGWPDSGTKYGAQQYFDWFKYEFWRFVFVQ